MLAAVTQRNAVIVEDFRFVRGDPKGGLEACDRPVQIVKPLLSHAQVVQRVGVLGRKGEGALVVRTRRLGIVPIELRQSQVIEIVRVFVIQPGRLGQGLDGPQQVAHLHAGDAEQMMGFRMAGVGADEFAVQALGILKSAGLVRGECLLQ